MKKLTAVLLSIILVFGTIIVAQALTSEEYLEDLILRLPQMPGDDYYTECDGDLDDEGNPYKEEKKICKATLKNDFDGKEVLVVLDNATSLKLKSYTVDDFTQINAAKVEDLTKNIIDDNREYYNNYIEYYKTKISEDYGVQHMSISEEMIDENAEKGAFKKLAQREHKFHQIICITLKNKGKKEVLNAVRELEKLDYVLSAEPNYIIKCVGEKTDNPMKITVKTKSVKYKKLKNAKQTVTTFSVKKAQGKVSYKKLSGSKKLTLKSNGKIVVKKGAKKGVYTMKVKITAKGNSKYKSKSKTVKNKVRVR